MLHAGQHYENGLGPDPAFAKGYVMLSKRDGVAAGVHPGDRANKGDDHNSTSQYLHGAGKALGKAGDGTANGKWNQQKQHGSQHGHRSIASVYLPELKALCLWEGIDSCWQIGKRVHVAIMTARGGFVSVQEVRVDGRRNLCTVIGNSRLYSVAILTDLLIDWPLEWVVEAVRLF